MNLQPLWRCGRRTSTCIAGNRATAMQPAHAIGLGGRKMRRRLDAVRSTSSPDQRLASAYLAARPADATVLDATPWRSWGTRTSSTRIPMAAAGHSWRSPNSDRLAGAPMGRDRLRPLARSTSALSDRARLDGARTRGHRRPSRGGPGNGSGSRRTRAVRSRTRARRAAGSHQCRGHDPGATGNRRTMGKEGRRQAGEDPPGDVPQGMAGQRPATPS